MQKKKINSRSKGATGEREWRDVIKSYGYDARRGCQRSGAPDAPDVHSDSLFCFQWEVKRAQQLNLEKALQQATRDGGSRKLPVVAHRRNGERWKITLWSDDFFKYFISAFIGFYGEEAAQKDIFKVSQTERSQSR